MDSAAVYRIGTAARMVGVEVATLRNWEQRYGLVIATRGSGSQRLYSPDDIDRLHAVKHWIDGGLSAGEAHGLLRQRAVVSEPPHANTEGWHVRSEARRLRAEVAQTQMNKLAERGRA